METLEVPKRITKIIDNLKKIKKEGDRVFFTDLGPSKGYNLNWLIELGIIEVVSPKDRKRFNISANLYSQGDNIYIYTGKNV